MVDVILRPKIMPRWGYDELKWGLYEFLKLGHCHYQDEILVKDMVAFVVLYVMLNLDRL